jgi:hypothetical protein
LVILEDVYGMKDFRSENTNVENTATHKTDKGANIVVDITSSVFHQEYGEIYMRISQRMNRFTIQYTISFYFTP